LAPGIWNEPALLALEQIMDRIASQSDRQKFIRFSAPDDTQALSKGLKTRFGIEIEHSVKGGEASLYADGDVAFQVAAFLQAETAQTVSVFDPAYRLERPNPVFRDFKDKLSR
ncbi:MAG: hypothetical protein AAF829_08355, partial [Pseudomonadota bacterium]